MTTTYLYQGRKVHLVAGRDADPDAIVWIAYNDEPDRDDYVPFSELEELRHDLETIARETLGLETLADRGGDEVDFHDLHVGNVRDALAAAYAVGFAAGTAQAAR